MRNKCYDCPMTCWTSSFHLFWPYIPSHCHTQQQQQQQKTLVAGVVFFLSRHKQLENLCIPYCAIIVYISFVAIEHCIMFLIYGVFWKLVVVWLGARL